MSTKINHIEKITQFLIELQKKNPSNTDSLFLSVFKEIDYTPNTLPVKWGGKKENSHRPKSAYNFFVASQDIREDIKKKHGNLSVSETMKIIAEMWKNLSMDEKKVYIDMANEDKKNYSGSEESKKTIRGRNGYQVFCNDNREDIRSKNTLVNGREITKILSDNWKNLTDEEKNFYKKKAIDLNNSDPVQKKEKKISKTDSMKNDMYHILNPETGRLVLKSSKKGKTLVQKTNFIEEPNDSDSSEEPKKRVKKIAKKAIALMKKSKEESETEESEEESEEES